MSRHSANKQHRQQATPVKEILTEDEASARQSSAATNAGGTLYVGAELSETGVSDSPLRVADSGLREFAARSIAADATLGTEERLDRASIDRILGSTEVRKAIATLASEGVPGAEIAWAMLARTALDGAPLLSIETRIEAARALRGPARASDTWEKVDRALGEVLPTEGKVPLAEWIFAAVHDTSLKVALRALPRYLDEGMMSELYRVERLYGDAGAALARFWENPHFDAKPPKSRFTCYAMGREVKIPGDERTYRVLDGGTHNVELVCHGTRVGPFKDALTIMVPAGFIEPHNPPTWGESVATFLANTAYAFRMGVATIRSLGGVHPAKVNGEWTMVVEPWARIANDPKQEEGQNKYGADNRYYHRFKKMKDEGATLVDTEALELGLPTIRVSAAGKLTFINHHRIRGAQDAGIAITVGIARDYDSAN